MLRRRARALNFPVSEGNIGKIEEMELVDRRGDQVAGARTLSFSEKERVDPNLPVWGGGDFRLRFHLCGESNMPTPSCVGEPKPCQNMSIQIYLCGEEVMQ